MITNGTVSVEDGTKANEDYAPARKVRVELSFSIDEGANEDAVLHDISLKASNKVLELLGRKKGAAPIEAAPVEVEKPKATRKKAETLPPVENFSIEAPKENTAKKPDETIIEDSILGVEEAPKIDVSDKAMYDLVVAVNARIKQPQNITKIITDFCPQDGVPPSLKRVPEDKRVKFIETIKAFAAAHATK